MAEGYWAVMGQRMLFWSGWFFTVFGVIVGLYLSKEYAWIGILIAVFGLLPLGTHSWWVHQRLAETQQRHQVELEDAHKQHRDEIARREQAEQRLAEVPVVALNRLAALVGEGAIKELVSLLAQQADLIGRLRLFEAEETKPLSVRSFERLHGELYVVARGIEGAIKHLRTGDPFILFRSNESGVEIEAARLAVHQPIKPDADSVFLRVVAAITDDITHLTGLAGERRVEGLKGYRLDLALELSRLPAMDFSKVAEAIPHLAAGIPKARGANMIQTKVARIIDPTQVVLAVGEIDGVKEGMEFVIYDLSDQILDPETKEDLGRIELVKGRVIAEHVQDKITIARTLSRQVEQVIDPMRIVSASLLGNLYQRFTIKESVYEQLKVEGAVAIQKDQIVRVGDRVRSITEAASIARYVTA